MQIEVIIAAAFVVLFLAVMLVFKIYQNKEGTGSIVQQFIDLYSDKVIDILKESISILAIKAEDFSTKEEYEKAIIRKTIDTIKSNYYDLGIDLNILGIITDDMVFAGDSDTLTNIIYELFQKNYKNVFSVLSKEIIENNSKLYNIYELNK